LNDYFGFHPSSEVSKTIMLLKIVLFPFSGEHVTKDILTVLSPWEDTIVTYCQYPHASAKDILPC
jgi:hypothetical protein